MWVHPSHSTVGSALRLVGERLGEQGAGRARGLVVVPHDEAAAWWPLTRHFDVVGLTDDGLYAFIRTWNGGFTGSSNDAS